MPDLNLREPSLLEVGLREMGRCPNSAPGVPCTACLKAGADRYLVKRPLPNPKPLPTRALSISVNPSLSSAINCSAPTTIRQTRRRDAAHGIGDGLWPSKRPQQPARRDYEVAFRARGPEERHISTAQQSHHRPDAAVACFAAHYAY